MEQDYAEEGVTQVFQFDGQTVWADRGTPLLEVGNFLGGGAAGTVYECEHTHTRAHYALKILNPLGYKLLAPALLRKCVIVCKGEVLKSSDRDKEVVEKRHVWWLLDGSTKQHIAAYYSERQSCLKDMSLVQCIQVWGASPPSVSDDDRDARAATPTEDCVDATSGVVVQVPTVPSKYADFVRRRGRIFREIKNMRKISTHVNVIRLESVLELTQESKCTIFLVMELANGGELFDRIKIDCGTRESTAKYFFQQLLHGVQHCHVQGVCHRDLKPENLLLQDGSDDTVLKIADFGFSARFFDGDHDSSTGDERKTGQMNSAMHDAQVMHSGVTPVAPASLLEEYSPLKMLKSVVGSPFYVAPEVLQARGYDGPKADIWSLGVILYAMLAGNLPFGQELGNCKRFRHFCKWVREQQNKNERFWEAADLEYPPWLFPARFSGSARGLIVSMLHPDPNCRITIAEAQQHPLCYRPPVETPVSAPQPEPVPLPVPSVAPEPALDAVVEMASQMSLQCDQEGSIEGEGDGEVDDEGGFFRMEEEDGDESSQRNSSVDGGTATAAGQSSPSTGVGAATVFSGLVGNPPPAPQIEPTSESIDDLVIADEDVAATAEPMPMGVPAPGAQVPAFRDVVKRSTRFLTSVPARDVLSKVERLLEECHFHKTQTPVGFIGKVAVNWVTYRLEVWGEDTMGPPMSALQLYAMPLDTVVPASPAGPGFMAGSFDGGSVSRPVFLVEFIRGELEIFIFKRFYQWVREKISELVKRDWNGSKYLDYMSPSPRLDSALLQRYQQGYH